MCANCNNMLGVNTGNGVNGNNSNGNVGLFIDNGNTAGLSTFNNDAIVNPLNNNSVSYNNSSCNCNNQCGCSDNNGCNCNGNRSCSCNCNGNNTANLANNTTSNNFQENLRNFIGRRCTCEFNICGSCSKRTGILTCVGSNFITLASTNNNNCLLCDTAGLNFVTVHNC